MPRRKPPKQVWVYMDDYGQLCETFEKRKEAMVFSNVGVVAKYARVDAKPRKKST